MRTDHTIFHGKKAVIFDMDGTLIDSIGVWTETDRLLVRELTGKEPEVEVIHRLREESLRRFREEENPYLCYCGVLAEKYAPAMDAREVYERRYAISQALLERLDYKPGADRLLRSLKAAGYILILATTTRRRTIELYETKNKNLMEKAPLDKMFDRIYTCEDVQKIKPDPEIYERIFADTGFRAGDCLVFEDSLAGVQAAKAAGIEVAAAYDRHSDGDRAAINALADFQVPDFAGLAQQLEL